MSSSPRTFKVGERYRVNVQVLLENLKAENSNSRRCNEFFECEIRDIYHDSGKYQFSGDWYSKQGEKLESCWDGHFSELFLVDPDETPKTKEELILEKIRYLNEKYPANQIPRRNY